MSQGSLLFRPSAGPDYPRWSETLRDRSHVLIRPILPQDELAERAFSEGLPAQARRYRFLGQAEGPGDAMPGRATRIDYVHEVVFVAVVAEDAHERIVGVSRYRTDREGMQCECAVAVSDVWQHKGLGTLLMLHLIEVARARGIRRMSSTDSAENVQMRDLARYLGFRSRVDPDDVRQVIYELSL